MLAKFIAFSLLSASFSVYASSEKAMFEAHASVVKLAAELGERCVADFNATGNKTQCQIYDDALQKTVFTQRNWHKEIDRSQPAHLPSEQEEWDDFQKDAMRLNQTIMFIDAHEADFPLPGK